MASKLKNNTERSRYELEIEGNIVFANYRMEGKTMHILHVEAPPELRGTGAAGTFMKALMEETRAQDFKSVPVCGYAAMWIQRHKEYRDLLA